VQIGEFAAEHEMEQLFSGYIVGHGLILDKAPAAE
jgi:hypothetical protein